MPQYQLGAPAFRLASMPTPEVRLWSTSGFAGGIQPWWHHIGSMHEDRRQYTTAEPIFTWHEENQDLLVDRELRADVGVSGPSRTTTTSAAPTPPTRRWRPIAAR